MFKTSGRLLSLYDYMHFPLQNQTTGLANSSADSIFYRSTASLMFFKVTILKNFSNFTGTQLWCWSLFLNKDSGLKAYNFIKKDSNTGVLLRNWRNFQEQLFLQSTSCGAGIQQEPSMHSPDKLQLKTCYYGLSQFCFKKFKVCYA